MSEFGDLYVWGWNKQGQLGIATKRKGTLYALPELVDVVSEGLGDAEEIELISCGSAHTIIYTKSGKLLGTGSCAFGQLANISSTLGFTDQFELLPWPQRGIKKIICGPLTSFILSSVPL